MGIVGMMVSNIFKMHPAPAASFAKPGIPINTGVWGLYFLFFYFISVVTLSSSLDPFFCLFCLPVVLILAIIPALLITSGIWLLWNILRFLWPDEGLKMGFELGKFEHAIGKGWNYSKYLLKQKMTLNMIDSSPHLLIVGGSQTGKSSTIKTAILKLIKDPPKHTKLEAVKQCWLPILLTAIPFYLYLSYAFPLFALTAGIILFITGWMMPHYIGIGLWICGGFGIIGVMALFVKRRYTSIISAMQENKRNVILDFHGEYGFLEDRGFTIIDARDYNPLAPNYEKESFEHIVSDYINAFLVAYETTGDVQLAILKKRLEEKRDGKEALSAIIGDSRSARSYTEKDRLTGLYLRLEKLAAYNGSKTVAQLTEDKQNIIFDFSGIRDRDAADFFAENILSRYMAQLTDKQGGINIIIDEAHRLNTKPLAERGFEPTTIRIARESGKFGGRLIIASQNLTDFPAGFSANFGNIICFRTPSGAELQILEKITGINYGLLQSVMNGLKKGEALLIGPHNHYSVVKVSMPEKFPAPQPKDKSIPEQEVVPEPEEIRDIKPTPRISRRKEILKILQENQALTVTELSRKTGFPKATVWRHLQVLTKTGKAIRYEETETPQGIEVFYEIIDPHRKESGFHKVLIQRVYEELKQAGEVKVVNEWGMPDLVFKENIAIEVETGIKTDLQKFREQVEKRFEQGYRQVIVVVINQMQKKRYEKTLSGMNKVQIVKFTGLN
jgi:DNA helicase HerA-like ATPase/predicted transcriptional regulator